MSRSLRATGRFLLTPFLCLTPQLSPRPSTIDAIHVYKYKNNSLAVAALLPDYSLRQRKKKREKKKTGRSTASTCLS